MDDDSMFGTPQIKADPISSVRREVSMNDVILEHLVKISSTLEHVVIRQKNLEKQVLECKTILKTINMVSQPPGKKL